MKSKRGMDAKSTVVITIVLLILMAFLLYLAFRTNSKGTSAFAQIKDLFRYGTGSGAA